MKSALEVEKAILQEKILEYELLKENKMNYEEETALNKEKLKDLEIDLIFLQKSKENLDNFEVILSCLKFYNLIEMRFITSICFK